MSRSELPNVDGGVAIGYVYGRVDGGDRRLEQPGRANQFETYFLAHGAPWSNISALYEAFVAEVTR